METLEKILSSLDKLQGLSAVALVFLSCIVAGYFWRFIPFGWFPNKAIPVMVILWGSVAMSFIADPRAATMPARVWVLRNMIIGGIIGLTAWLAHNFLIKRLEQWIASLFPSLNDTTFFHKEKSDKTDAAVTPPETKQ